MLVGFGFVVAKLCFVEDEIKLEFLEFIEV